MTLQSQPVPLPDATDAPAFGGKAAQLAVAAAAGLPVPAGFALPWQLVDAVAAGERQALAALGAAPPLEGGLAVRSSGVDEDSAGASFAGQHLSRLNVAASQLPEAVKEVCDSARGDAALAYRRRMDLDSPPRIGVVVQEMVDAQVSGVLFRPNPITGADECVIEAAWGLGEAVVGGLVTPDLFRVGLQGEVLERRVGTKDVEIASVPGGGTSERSTDADRARAPCLDDRQLGELLALAAACVRVFEGSQDLEWAFADGRLWLLQRRPVTGAPPGAQPASDEANRSR